MIPALYGSATPAQLDFLFKVIKSRTSLYSRRMVVAMAKIFIIQHDDIRKNINNIIENNGEVDLTKYIQPLADSVRTPIFMSSKDGYYAGYSGDSIKGYLDFEVKTKPKVVGAIDFTMDNPGISEWLDKHTWKFSFDVNDNLKQGIGKIVEKEINIGGAQEDITERVMDKLNSRYKWLYGEKGNEYITAWQSRRIALTETGTAQNAGHLSGMVNSGVVKYKGWLSSRNAKVRPTHQAADSKYSRNNGIPLNENFIVGAATMSAPGVLVGGDYSERINCHCSLISAKSGKSKGGSQVCFPNNIGYGK